MRPELRRILDDLPGLEAVLERATERFVRLSRIGGTIDLTAAERRAVERLGCRVEPGERVKLAELDRALRSSRLAAPLPEVLSDYRGERVVTRADARAREDAAWLSLTERLAQVPAPAWARDWFEEEERPLRAEWRRQDPTWATALELALRAVAALETAAEGTELPRLANQVSGDAHCLDPDRAAGRMFERLLVRRHRDAGFSLPLSAEARESVFAMSRLAVDEISSTVHVVGLAGGDPMLEAARAGRHVLALPLRTLYGIQERIRSHREVVFAVENRSVLAALHRRLADVPTPAYPTLVCTGGHVSLAALRLLDALVRSGSSVHYSGDFDAAGLLIADTLASRLGPAFYAWRMDAESYALALARRTAGGRIEPGRFSRGAEARFPELARRIGEDGAAYQEGLTDPLERDLRAWIGVAAPCGQMLTP